MKRIFLFFTLILSFGFKAQTDFSGVDFGFALSQKSLYPFILELNDFAEPSALKFTQFRKATGIHKLKVEHYRKLPLSETSFDDSWIWQYTDVMNFDHDGIALTWTRKDSTELQPVMAIRQKKDSVTQTYRLSRGLAQSRYFKGRLINNQTLSDSTGLNKLAQSDFLEMDHLPIEYRYTADHRLLNVQHCCHNQCSFELKYSYPKKGIILVTYLQGEGKEAEIFENKQVYDEQGRILKSSFRRKTEPEVIVRYLFNYDKEGRLFEVIKQSEDRDAVREEVWVKIKLTWQNHVLYRRDVTFKDYKNQQDFSCIYDETGRIVEFIRGDNRFVYAYNGKATLD